MHPNYCHSHAQTKECDVKYEEFNRKLTASFWHLQNYNDRLWPMIIFGSLMFIPGSYHVFLAVQTFRGVPGYLFDEYPTFDWFMVMISIFTFFFQNYFLLHWCIVIMYISCSPDPSTTSKTTVLNFHEILTNFFASLL